MGNSLPKERFDADSKRQLTADETDFLLRMLNTGDPLADAVIEELYRLGPDANRALLDGLANGRASLVNPPPAVDALLQQTETLPAWVEPDILHRGSTAYLTIDPLWNDIALSIGSLIHIYAAPGIARVLAATKDLTTLEIAGHRLAETAVWVYGTMLPDGLARGARGYVGTIQVRLLHARVRNAALRHGWDTAGWGTPINQVDLARTWLDFTLTPYRTLTAFGFDFTDGELRDAYHLWQYLAYLLGIDPEIYRNVAARTDVADHAEARKLLELLDVTNTAPIDQSRALVKPMMDIMTQSIVDTLKAPLPLTNDVTAA
ncbi:MAG TPA: oxygenase MpaB family protein, partial [Candidatus Acidoferrales bacterium]|nr:oxygenase MpaB family protein [Candidatus Acidoferrales bacterium]